MSGMEHTQSIVESILRSMDISWKHISIEKGFFDREIVFNIDGGTSYFIGRLRNGEGIAALNSLVHILSEQFPDIDQNYSVDVDGYRRAAIETLCKEAEDSITTLISSKDVSFLTMRPMTAYERKVIHDYIQKTYPEYTTLSEGEGMERRIVIKKN